MVKLDLFWRSNEDWYHITDSNNIVINDDAPLEAKESYFKYIKQLKEIDKRTSRCFVVPKMSEGIKWYYENDPDWDKGTHETKYVIVYDIPYEEYVVLRKLDGIDDLLDEYESKRLSPKRIREYIHILKIQAPQLVKLIDVLDTAVKCETFVDFVEEHIL